MPNRRDFLMTVAGATATGMFVTGRGFAQGRREVFVGGRRASVVDIHAHCAWPEVSDLLKGTDMEGRETAIRGFSKSEVVGPEWIQAVDARGISRGAKPLHRIRPWTSVEPR